MQKCFLVANKSTQVREYLEHRSIISVEQEYRTLSELDLSRLGIIDVDKFIYLYYGSDDGDLGFRSDLNILRQLLNSAFFNATEAIFILVGTSNPMLEDLIHSACRDTNIIGSHLSVIHHSGALTLNDVSTYISGVTTGVQGSSSYKSVYVREEDSEERERFNNVIEDGVEMILPVLTDQYAMYKKRAEVEAISSSRSVTETFFRPQTVQNFAKRTPASHKQWNAFLLSGTQLTAYTKGVDHMRDYFSRVGMRMMIVDLSSNSVDTVNTEEVHEFSLSELSSKRAFTESAGYVKCRFNQLGFVVGILDHVVGVNVYVFVCDEEDYIDMSAFLAPLCSNLVCNFVTHFAERYVQRYLASGMKSTALFLSRNVVSETFDLLKYKEDFEGTRVASFGLKDVDTTDYYECATGGGMLE